ncbi:MAG: hypothetical protein NC131_00870 [Roseburia sp.]|nr:hypothetical protein [Roseburia sp.]
MLLCTIQDWEAWTSIFANIATIIGVTLVVIAIIPLIKNRLSKKTFNIISKIKFKAFAEYGKYDEYECDICFQNYTDKCFHITKLCILMDGKEYEIHNRNVVNRYNVKEPTKNISVEPYQAFDRTVYVLLPATIENNASKKVKAKLKIYTTRKILLYDIEIKRNTNH